jgi:predicted nucleotidyltransferase
MAKNRSALGAFVQPYRYPSPNIPFAAIRRFACKIAERFHPEKIILFGSYAYGQPHGESDVDLMVIMPSRNVIDQAIRIDLAFERPFSVDVHVRTPSQIRKGLKEGDCDWFLREVMEKGKVLYEAPDGFVGQKGRRGHTRGKSACRATADSPRRRVLPLSASGRKYLKALLQELGAAVPRTHDMEDLLDLLLPHDPPLAPQRRSVASLTKYAVECRNPSMRATNRQMGSALRITERLRAEIRARLGLPT